MSTLLIQRSPRDFALRETVGMRRRERNGGDGKREGGSQGGRYGGEVSE
jgi:hypothetical protein